jgi:hypothetical protein
MADLCQNWQVLNGGGYKTRLTAGKEIKSIRDPVEKQLLKIANSIKVTRIA